MQFKHDKYINFGKSILLPSMSNLYEFGRVESNSIFPVSNKYSINYDKLFKPFLDGKILKNANKVVFHRDAGLGDVILAIPVLRQLKKFYNIKNVYYQTNRYYNVINDIFKDINFVNECPEKYDFILKLNNVLERDHEIGSVYSYINRVQIYQDFLELPQTVKLDWSFDDDNSNILFDDEDIVVGLQIRAMNKVRMFDTGFVKKIASRIVSNGYKCMIFDADCNYGWESDNIINSCGKLTVKELFGNIKRMKACITYDSSAFWITHFTKTPTLCIFGSTRPEERLNYHPLYKDNSVLYIDMKTYCGCNEHCCGTGSQCKWTGKCFHHFNEESVLNDISYKLTKLIGV